MVTREGLDSKMNPLVSLQIVVAVEALGALVALERSVIRGLLLVRRVPHEMRHCRSMATVETWHHSWVHTDQRQLAVRILDV